MHHGIGEITEYTQMLEEARKMDSSLPEAAEALAVLGNSSRNRN
jgi:hypothetical protein